MTRKGGTVFEDPPEPPPEQETSQQQPQPQCSQPADIFRAKTEDLGDEDDS